MRSSVRVIARRVVFVTVIALQLFFIARAYWAPHMEFGFHMFPESSTWKASVVRVTGDGRRVPVEQPWSGYRWDDVETPRVAVNGVVPIGEVHAGHDYVLLDGDDAEGELCIAGPQMTPGYLDPADERGRFLERDGKRFYRTGDRVRRLADGLAYLGRLDSQVQVLGWRIELTEVEHALRDCGVQDAVALGVAGDAGTELFVFYTGGERPVLEMVRALRAVLPEGVIPRHYRHVDEFPLNSNRKIDRKTLAARAAELLAPAPVG